MCRRAFVADFDAMEQPFQYIRTAWHQRYLLDDPFFFVALFDVFILYGFPKKLLLENLFCNIINHNNYSKKNLLSFAEKIGNFTLNKTIV